MISGRRQSRGLSARMAIVLAAIGLVLAAGPARAVKRRAFVTSVSGNGNLFTWPGATGLSGIERADSVCRARATAGGLPNANTYRAWLSTPAVDAYCHVQGLSGKKISGCDGAILPGGGPWFLANGLSSFTGTLDELIGSQRVIYRPVLFDEFMNELSPAEAPYWTGTFQSGYAESTSCGGWTGNSAAQEGTTGYALASSVLWTSDTTSSCDQSRRLLCLEPGVSETVTLAWSPGALVFLTSEVGPGDLASWPRAAGTSGIAAGTRICQSLAAEAGLPSPGSFVPWLSTSSVDARDLVTTDGPFRRPDGYTVAGNLLDLTDGTNSNSIHVLENGHYLMDDEILVWTGTAGDGLAVLSELCGDWTVGDNTAHGRSGGASYARSSAWTNANGFVCSRLQHLYCVGNGVTLFWDGFESGAKGRWSH